MSSEDEIAEIKERLFARSKRKRDPDVLILMERQGEVDVSDPDVAAWAHATVRKKLGFREKEE